jgi:circadian clock protein KaiC
MNDSERIATGIPGLDTVLKGGVLRGGIYIVQGMPGSGKTILGNQLCFNRAAAGARALYVTLLAETHARMIAHMERLRFFDAAAIPERVAYMGAFSTLEDEGLHGLLALIRREVCAREAEIVVLDGLATVSDSTNSKLELKKFVHELQTQAVFTGCTMFLLSSSGRNPLSTSPEYTMVDGLIELKSRMFGRRSDRELQVHKLRGSDSINGEHAFRITSDGIVVFPRFEAAFARPSVVERPSPLAATSGIPELDVLMGGGPDQRSVTLLLGPAGSGKTTIGLQFLSATGPQETGLLFSFNETPDAARLKARSLGLPLGSMIEAGRVDVLWQPPTEALLDEVCMRLVDTISRRKVRRLLIDDVGGFDVLCPDKARSASVLAALCNELRGLGVTTLMTSETELSGIIPGQPLAGLALQGLSPIAENIVVLRVAAVRADIHRLIAVLKAREKSIDMRMRRFDIGKGGVIIEQDFGKAETVLRELMQTGQLLPSPAGIGASGG